MKIFGFYVYESRIIFVHFLAVLLLGCFFDGGGVNAFSVVRSTRTKDLGDVDTFSNPLSNCSHVGCSRVTGAAGCKAGDCCICKCATSAPNFLIHSRICVANEFVDRACEYSTLPTDKLIKVTDMSKGGLISFDADLDICSSLEVIRWVYRLDTPKWKKGQPNHFRVYADKFTPGRWSLQWDRGLDRKYSGLILRFDLTCAGNFIRIGCLLVKSKGNYSLSGAPSSSPPAVVKVTETKVKPTTWSKKTDTMSPNNNDVNVDANREKTLAETKRELAKKNHIVVAAGVGISIVIGIVLICVTMLRLKRKKRSQDPANEQPVNQSTPNSSQGCTSVHNEIYDAESVLTIGTQTTESSSRPTQEEPPYKDVMTQTIKPKQEEPSYKNLIPPRNFGYHGLVKETKEAAGPSQSEPITEEEPSPVYNTLEPPSDEAIYDDVVC